MSLECDGIVVATGNSPNFAFSWNAGAVTAGSHTLTVRASNSSGNSGSASLAINVTAPPITTADAVAPVVRITSPGSGTSLSNVTRINVTATDNVAVQQVSIYIDGTLVYTGAAAPYTFNWNTNKVTPGAHAITAKAWDAAGNSASAAPVSVYR